MDKTFFKRYAGLLGVCTVFLAMGLLRINDTSLYTPDSSNYVIWGNSLAQGKGWVDDTAPVPDYFIVNAPLYPLLIAPVEVVFPLSIIAVKIWTLLWGLAALILLFLWLERTTDRTIAVIGTLLAAMNPAMIIFSTEALSEAPFILFLLVIFFLAEKIHQQDGERGMDNRTFVVLILFVATAGLLREVGIAILIAMTLYLISIRQFRHALFLLLTSAAILGLWYYRNQVWVSSIQGPQQGNLSIITRHYVTPPDASLINEIVLRVWMSLKVYASHWGDMVVYPIFSAQLGDMIVGQSPMFRAIQSAFSWGNIVVLLISIFLCLIGIREDIRTRTSSWFRIIFSLLFLGIVCTYPVHDIRFLLPLLPVIIYFHLVGIKRLVSTGQSREMSVLRRRLIVVVPIFVILPNLLGIGELLRTNTVYVTAPDELKERGPAISAAYTYRWKKLQDWMKIHIPEYVTIVTPMKELAIVAGPRKVVELDPGVTIATFESVIRENGAQYIVAVARGDQNIYDFHMTGTRRFWFEPVFDAENLHLLKIHSQFLEPAGRKQFSPNDTITSLRLMKEGRRLLNNGKYAEAESTVLNAYHRYPRNPDIVFHAMAASFFAGDTIRGKQLYKELLALPQTMSYANLANNHLHALAQATMSKTAEMREERAVVALKAAKLYWSMGYYRYATDFLNASIGTDTSYFFGMLWGIHFNLQNGDTIRARTYFNVLMSIDSTNPVVKAFTRVFNLADSLHHAATDLERSLIHLTIADVYRKIDLKDESIDEGECALRYNPSNTKALLLMGEVFEKKNCGRRAEHLYRQALMMNPDDSTAMVKVNAFQRRPAGS